MRDIAPETVFEHVMTWISRASGASAEQVLESLVGDVAARRCAEIMRDECGWSDARGDKELCALRDDPDGTLWVGSGDGLALFEDSKVGVVVSRLYPRYEVPPPPSIGTTSTMTLVAKVSTGSA